MKTFEFSLGDGWVGNIEYDFDSIGYGFYQFIGTLYVTSEYSEGVSWASELDDVFASEQEMLLWAQELIRNENT